MGGWNWYRQGGILMGMATARKRSKSLLPTRMAKKNTDYG